MSNRSAAASRKGTPYLAAINFFTGDIQGGLGPFLGSWLAQTARWSPDRIGLASSIVGLGTVLLNAPAGALVDRIGKPRLLLGLGCLAILAGTLLLLPAREFAAVLAAQTLASLGGIVVIPALTALTLGIVGKKKFPHQQGRNQAFNHAGILTASLLIAGGARLVGISAAFWVLGFMALAAIVTVFATPASAWNGRRAMGWKEEEPDDCNRRHSARSVLGNRRLLWISVALSLFALSNGTMLSLIAQRLVVLGRDSAGWTAAYVFVAQITMIPIALWAGSLADRRGRRRLVLVACLMLCLRAVLSSVFSDPRWLILPEILDGVGSGLIGVAVPVLVADLTWGSGRTQTALGTVNGLQGIGGALSGVVSGYLVRELGWAASFAALAAPAALAAFIVFRLEETRDIELAYPPAGTKC